MGTFNLNDRMLDQLETLKHRIDLLERRDKEHESVLKKQDKEIEDLNTVVQDLLGYLGKDGEANGPTN